MLAKYKTAKIVKKLSQDEKDDLTNHMIDTANALKATNEERIDILCGAVEHCILSMSNRSLNDSTIIYANCMSRMHKNLAAACLRPANPGLTPILSPTDNKSPVPYYK